VKELMRLFRADKEVKMRHFKSAVLWLCFASFLFSPVLLKAEGSPASIRLWGGLNYLLAKDVNDGNEGQNDYITAFAEVFGWSASGETSPIRMGYDFGGDLIVNLTPRVGLGFGAGYIQGTKESVITFTQGTDTITMTSKPNIRAIPLRASLFLNLPMGERAYFNLNVGAGYYISKYSYEWKDEGTSFGSTVYNKITQEATANGLGFHGGIGFEFDLTSNLAFFIEGQARYAKISGFEGTAKEEFVDGSEQEEGKLYYYELQFDTDYNFKQVFIRQTKPSDPEIINVREANVDFSGVCAVAGIKIKF
jgi:hypothetical protein